MNGTKKAHFSPSLPLPFLSPPLPRLSGLRHRHQEADRHGSKLAHEIVGYVVFSFVAVQALLGAMRPANAKPGEVGFRRRSRWFWGHRATGISLAVLAFINLILGLVLAGRGAGWIAGASVIWGGLVVAFSAKKVLDERKKVRKGAALAEANSSNVAWKASIADGGASITSASNGSSAAAAVADAAEMEMGKR